MIISGSVRFACGGRQHEEAGHDLDHRFWHHAEALRGKPGATAKDAERAAGGLRLRHLAPLVQRDGRGACGMHAPLAIDSCFALRGRKPSIRAQGLTGRCLLCIGLRSVTRLWNAQVARGGGCLVLQTCATSPEWRSGSLCCAPVDGTPLCPCSFCSPKAVVVPLPLPVACFRVGSALSEARERRGGSRVRLGCLHEKAFRPCSSAPVCPCPSASVPSESSLELMDPAGVGQKKKRWTRSTTGT